MGGADAPVLKHLESATFVGSFGDDFCHVFGRVSPAVTHLRVDSCVLRSLSFLANYEHLVTLDVNAINAYTVTDDADRKSTPCLSTLKCSMGYDCSRIMLASQARLRHVFIDGSIFKGQRGFWSTYHASLAALAECPALLTLRLRCLQSESPTRSTYGDAEYVKAILRGAPRLEKLELHCALSVTLSAVASFLLTAPQCALTHLRLAWKVPSCALLHLLIQVVAAWGICVQVHCECLQVFDQYMEEFQKAEPRAAAFYKEFVHDPHGPLDAWEPTRTNICDHWL